MLQQNLPGITNEYGPYGGHLSSAIYFQGVYPIPQATAPWIARPKVFFFLASAVSPNECSSTALDLLKVVGTNKHIPQMVVKHGVLLQGKSLKITIYLYCLIPPKMGPI